MAADTRTAVAAASLFCLALVGSAGYLAFRGWAPVADPFRKGTDVAIQDSPHVAEGTVHAAYGTDPPTSGPHYSRTTLASLKGKDPTDEAMLGLMQDGYVWISYDPDRTDSASLSALEGIPREAREQDAGKGRIIVTPRRQAGAPIAIAGWGRLMKLQGFNPELTDDEVHAFISSLRANPRLRPDGSDS
jgi:hypothetical protein